MSQGSTVGPHSALAGKKTVQPALEVGLGAGSLLQCQHSPPLQAIDAAGNLAGEPKLGSTIHVADMEGCLLEAAAVNADLQLGEATFC